ncbi:2-dehydropantoate 2-reductase [Gordonia McavH-238-E]|uniref:ketopantoate reductase family protein n=1 Tax=Gordonia sp. McavH-238-E TaxID=2917736 RepID=UPI001EF68DCD|nr:2-dehydropantoate 2-reductase [Gordonia sp. McavH-238-E]MCG7632936.1 2-dehydropantoate 2-reductase [Gordonia sp. McavH-238-E]
MKYLIIGAGALGSCLAGFMHRAGKDVTLIARGEKLEIIRRDGITIETADGQTLIEQVKAVAAEDYDETPDVVVVCVKSYSLDSAFALLGRVCGPNTVILSLINALNVGDRIEAGMDRDVQIAEGVAYVAVGLSSPGVVKQKLNLFTVVLGARHKHPMPAGVERIAADLTDVGLTVEISDDMLRSGLRKFIRVSTLSAAEVYYDGYAGDVRGSSESMQYLRDLGNELMQIGDAAGVPVPGDPVAELVEAVTNVDADYATSLMVDHKNGNETEYESQFYDVYALGRAYGLPMEAYERVLRAIGYPGLPEG